MVEQSDQEFVETLRSAVDSYLRAVDRWEGAYNRYYRLPGRPYLVSSDMECDRASSKRNVASSARCCRVRRQLCLKYGQTNPFPALLRTSLGQHAPQRRIESAISCNERNAVTMCLEQQLPMRAAAFPCNHPRSERARGATIRCRGKPLDTQPSDCN